MLKISSPTEKMQNFNNFSMEEKNPIMKINLRGNLSNKDFTGKIGKILGVILPVEVGCIVIKEEFSIITLGPNEWIIISNEIAEKNNNSLLLENVLFEAISKTNLGAVTNVSDQFIIFSLRGSNIFEILSKSSPFDFYLLQNNSSIQTLLNNIDVTIVKNNEENVDLLVRRSFSEHLWNWIKDSANFI